MFCRLFHRFFYWTEAYKFKWAQREDDHGPLYYCSRCDEYRYRKALTAHELWHQR